jgi:hypothetical protein
VPGGDEYPGRDEERLNLNFRLSLKSTLVLFTPGFIRVIETRGNAGNRFKRFPCVNFSFGATWLKPGVNEIKCANMVGAVLGQSGFLSRFVATGLR